MESIRNKIVEQQTIIRNLILHGESKKIINHQLDKLELLNKIFEAQYKQTRLEA